MLKSVSSLLLLLCGQILARDCDNADVLVKCRNSRLGGFAYYNLKIWTPTLRQGEDCEPCCRRRNTSLDQCPRRDRRRWNNLPTSMDQVIASPTDDVVNNRGSSGNQGQNQEEIYRAKVDQYGRHHCPMDNVSFTCLEGSGPRVYSK